MRLLLTYHRYHSISMSNDCQINKFIDLIALHSSHLSIGSIAYSNDPIKENRTKLSV